MENGNGLEAQKKPKVTAPDWLNNDLLSKAIQSYKHDQTVKVLNFTIKKGFSEHYGSTMFQLSIVFSSEKFQKSENETLDVVLKARPVNAIADMLDISDIFVTEIRMYKEVLPAMAELFERSGMKVELAPELIYAANEPLDIIIMRDMSGDGFKAPQSPPNELEDSKMIIKLLAKFHAASYYLAENNELDLTKFKNTLFANPQMVDSFFGNTLEVFAEVLASWEGYENFIPNIENLKRNIIGLERVVIPNKTGNGYNVLNHGDFHLRNILVKMNENNRLEKLFFIDHQISSYCSPAVDLTYMIGMVKLNDEGELPYEELISFYHEEFVKTLKTIGFMKAAPSLLDLNIELMKNGVFKVIILICMIPMLLIQWDDLKIEDMMDKNFKRKLYENPICKKMLQREIKIWKTNGWI